MKYGYFSQAENPNLPKFLSENTGLKKIKLTNVFYISVSCLFTILKFSETHFLSKARTCKEYIYNSKMYRVNRFMKKLFPWKSFLPFWERVMRSSTTIKTNSWKNCNYLRKKIEVCDFKQKIQMIHRNRWNLKPMKKILSTCNFFKIYPHHCFKWLVIR